MQRVGGSAGRVHEVMDLTPSALYDIVLQAAQELAGGRPGTPIKASQVTNLVLARLDLPEDDAEGRRKASQNTNWVGTQVLVKAGLLKLSDKRGWWELVDSQAPPSPGAAPAEPAAAVILPETFEASPWAADPGGVTAFAPPTVQVYSEDPYILGLAIVATKCFGKYNDGYSTCMTCALARPCREQVFNTLLRIAQVLQTRDAQSPAPPETRQPPTPTLVDILGELNNLTPSDSTKAHPEPTPRPPHAGVLSIAAVPSVCYICKGGIPEGAQVVLVPTKGCRHVTCDR